MDPLLANLDRQRKLMHESNDCSVRSMVLTTRLDYEQAHQALALAGRKDNGAVMLYKIINAYRMAGYSTRLMRVRAKTVYSLPNDELILDTDNYLVVLSDHVAPMQGEEVLDWCKGKKIKLDSVYRIRIK